MSRDNILQYSRVSESCCVIGDDCVILLSKNVKKKTKTQGTFDWKASSSPHAVWPAQCGFPQINNCLWSPASICVCEGHSLKGNVTLSQHFHNLTKMQHFICCRGTQSGDLLSSRCNVLLAQAPSLEVDCLLCYPESSMLERSVIKCLLRPRRLVLK